MMPTHSSILLSSCCQAKTESIRHVTASNTCGGSPNVSRTWIGSFVDSGREWGSRAARTLSFANLAKPEARNVSRMMSFVSVNTLETLSAHVIRRAFRVCGTEWRKSMRNRACWTKEITQTILVPVREQIDVPVEGVSFLCVILPESLLECL